MGAFRPETPRTPTIATSSGHARRRCSHRDTLRAAAGPIGKRCRLQGQHVRCGSAHGGVSAPTIRAALAARGAVRWSAHCRQREGARLPVTVGSDTTAIWKALA